MQLYCSCIDMHTHAFIIIIIISFFRPWYFIPRVWDIKQSV